MLTKLAGRRGLLRESQRLPREPKAFVAKAKIVVSESENRVLATNQRSLLANWRAVSESEKRIEGRWSFEEVCERIYEALDVLRISSGKWSIE